MTSHARQLGFGPWAGILGAVLLVLSASQPWLQAAPGMASSPRMTGSPHERILLILLLTLSVLTVIAVIRARFSNTLDAARAQKPLLLATAAGSLTMWALELWMLSPAPASGVHLAPGAWILVAGACLVLLSALLAGRHLRDDLDRAEPPRAGAEGVAFSHGAWVPRNPNQNGQQPTSQAQQRSRRAA